MKLQFYASCLLTFLKSVSFYILLFSTSHLHKINLFSATYTVASFHPISCSILYIACISQHFLQLIFNTQHFFRLPLDVAHSLCQKNIYTKKSRQTFYIQSHVPFLHFFILLMHLIRIYIMIYFKFLEILYS